MIGDFHINVLDTKEAIFRLAFNLSDGVCEPTQHEVFIRVISLNEFPPVFETEMSTIPLPENMQVPTSVVSRKIDYKS